MAQHQRSSIKTIPPGPYLAVVTNHMDPTYMGGLEVTVLKPIPGLPTTQGSNIIVRYCSPFLGSTSSKFEGNNSSNFNDVQKSYGFWMVPPDIGTRVLVLFLDGEINNGYWIGCVPDLYQNHMIPGLAASQYSAVGPADEAKYGTKLLPVAEYHKSSRDNNQPNPNTYTKPVHPFAERLVQQGLLADLVRGVTSSSARREIPSMVFGISTPGPVDKSDNAPRHSVGFTDAGQVRIPTSRLGGSQFVMDDGDRDGLNELIRIRTRTGHQILLHTSSDLIYIANSKGTAWIELTSNGKIDVYAEDSVSLHSKVDFNFRADRDINIEAGRNINIKTAENLRAEVGKNHRLFVVGTSTVTVKKDIDVYSFGNTRFSTSGTTHIHSAGNHIETASLIHMNGPSAEKASTATQFTIYDLPNRSPEKGWADGIFYKDKDIKSIMKRVPTHEPWEHHESVKPSDFTPDKTEANK